MSLEGFKRAYKIEMKDSCKRLEKFNWENREIYARWLAQTYHFVKNSTRVLAMAAGFSRPDESEMHKRMIEHLKEESGHEILALTDLRALGFSISDFPEMIETKNFYENQFFTVQNKGSSSLLGWIFFLEGIAEQFGKVAVVKTKVHGSKCTKFLRLHAEEDEGHVESAFELLKSVNEQDFNEIIYNFSNSKSLYTRILDNIEFSSSKKVNGNLMLSLY